MNLRELMKPFRRKVLIEAILRAVFSGLLFGALAALVGALAFQVSHYFRWIGPDARMTFILASVGAGVVIGVATGLLLFFTSRSTDADTVARKVDQLGLNDWSSD